MMEPSYFQSDFSTASLNKRYEVYYKFEHYQLVSFNFLKRADKLKLKSKINNWYQMLTDPTLKLIAN